VNGRSGDGVVFDTYVIVDWSASAKPKRGRDSIWICVLSGDRDGPWLANPPTRRKAGELLEQRLVEECEAGRRVLVGLDFAYGYPAGFAARLGLSTGEPPWRAIWRLLRAEITDGSTNANNRFDVAADMNARCGERSGPFWGCPAARASFRLTVRRLCTFPFAGGADEPPVGEYRIAEQRLRDRRRPVQSTWKLMGAGSVGSQALMGIPVVEGLRDHPALREVSQVWPFETGLSLQHATGPRIVHAEIWPGAVRLDASLHPIRDAAQVLTLARHLAHLDRSGALAEWFAPRLDPDETGIVTREEGWILGS
jgi:precorrin-8X/cobalt-precorrin-8 methylmutase